MKEVLQTGTFVAELGTQVYFGVRFNRDRTFLLRRLLIARSFRVEDIELTRFRHEAVERGIFLSFKDSNKSRHRIFAGEWYVIDTRRQVYILGDEDLTRFDAIRPMSIDWETADIFPRKLRENEVQNNDRYGKDWEW